MSSPTLNSAADADPITIAKKTYQAYIDKNRTAIRTETTAVCAGWQRRERLRRVEGANWPGGKAAGARSQGGQTAEDQPSVPGQ